MPSPTEGRIITSKMSLRRYICNKAMIERYYVSFDLFGSSVRVHECHGVLTVYSMVSCL